MTELGEVWAFTRVRLDAALDGLTDDQMRVLPWSEGHSIFEIAYHIAGAEHYWATRMLGIDPERTPYDAKLGRAIMDGFLREGNSPYGEEDLNLSSLGQALAYSEGLIRPIYEAPTEAQLTMRMKSPIGDDVSGREGLIRLAQHAGYHTGQIWTIRMMNGWE